MNIMMMNDDDNDCVEMYSKGKKFSSGGTK